MLDIIVLVIIGLLVVGGYTRGLIQAVVGLVGSFVAMLLASAGASVFAPGIYENFIQSEVVRVLEEMLPSFDPKAGIESITGALPDYAKNALDMAGITPDMLSSQLSKTNLSVPVMIEGMIRSVLIRLVTVILSFVLFLIIITIISLLTKSISVVAKKTGLALTDRVLGALLGLAETAVLIMIMTLIIYFLLVLLPQEDAQGLQQMIDSSLIYKQIYMFNLPEMIMNGISSLARS